MEAEFKALGCPARSARRHQPSPTTLTSLGSIFAGAALHSDDRQQSAPAWLPHIEDRFPEDDLTVAQGHELDTSPFHSLTALPVLPGADPRADDRIPRNGTQLLGQAIVLLPRDSRRNEMPELGKAVHFGEIGKTNHD